MKKHLTFVCCVTAILFAAELAVAQSSIFTQVGTIQGPAEAIASLVISPDGRTIAYGTFADTLIRIVDVETQQEIRTLSGHTNVVTRLAFSPNGELLASTGTVNLGTPVDGTVRVWDVASGMQLASVATAPAGTSQLAFSPNGSMLAGASGGNPLNVHLWDADSLSVIRTISGVFRMLAFSPDGSRIATGKRDDKLYLVDVATGSEITSFSGHTGWIHSVAYNSDGLLLATGGEDQTIQVRNAQSGETVRTLMGHGSYPDYLAFSPDASMMVSLGSGINITRTSGGGISITIGSADKFLRIWDVDTGTELPLLNIGSDVLSEVSLSANWNVLVTGSDSGLIRIFRGAGATAVAADQVPTTFELLQNYPNPFNPTTEIRFELREAAEVRLIVYDVVGREVARLVDAAMPAGQHRATWDASGLSSGTYLYRLTADAFTETKAMTLLK